jgi:hypothetical protein
MDLDRDARRILDLASDARAPGADDKARVEKKLGALLGVGVVASAAPAASTQAAQTASTTAGAAKATGATALKWWISSAVIASAVTGYVVLSNEPAPAAKPVKAPAMLAPPPPITEEPAAPIEEAGQAALPELPAPEKLARSSAARKHDPGSTLSQEIELLHRAQAAWRAHDAKQAMTLIDEHRERFPRSDLRLERDGLRVLTLCELGRKSEATALAEKLLERAPRSPLRATIEESCALK